MTRAALVVGGGVNGLVAAICLAQQGLTVTLLERRKRLGGLAGSWQFGGRYRVPGLLHEDTLLSPEVVKALDLTRIGLKRRVPQPIRVPDGSGSGFTIGAAAADRHLSAEDQQAFDQWQQFLGRIRPFLSRQLHQAPPSLELTGKDLWELGSAGVALRSLGRRNMLELIRILPMPVADWLRENFGSDAWCAALAFPALFGSFVGPRAAGTANNLLVYETLRGSAISGGPAALVEVLSQRAAECGVQIQTESEVEEILIRDREVVGVRTGSGRISTELVIATCHPAQALDELVDSLQLEVKEQETLRALRSRGTLAKVHLALDGPFELGAFPGQRLGRAYLGCESIDHLERCFDACKYGAFSQSPALDVRSYPAEESEGAGEGACHVLSILAFGAPHDLRDGWTESARQGFMKAVLDQLEAHSPGLSGRTLESELLTPVDLACEFRLPGGHLCHLEQALDQFASMRPVYFAARYRTPIRGLFLAGSGCHPGGGLTGLPGLLGARQALLDT